MNDKKWIRSSVAMILSSLIISSSATALTASAADAAAATTDNTASESDVVADDSNEEPQSSDIYIESFSVSPSLSSYLYANQALTFYVSVKNADVSYDSYTSSNITITKGGEQVAVLDYQYTDNGRKSWTPTETGTYTAKVYIQDWYGNIATKEITFDVVEATIESFTISPSSVVAVGSEVEFNATFKNATMHYGVYGQENIVIKKNGKEVATVSDRYNSNLKWTPTETGKYTATMNFKDFYGFAAEPKTISFEVVDELSATLSVPGGTTVPVARNFPINAAAAGGKGPYQYQFTLTRNGNETLVQDFSSSSTADFNCMTPGDFYTAKVTTKDASGQEVTKTLDLKAVYVLTSGIKTSTSDAVPGETVNIQASASTAQVPVTFKYEVAGETDTISTKLTTKSDGTADWVPAKAGNYNITVNMLFGNTVINTNTFAYTVKESDVAVKASVTPGTSIPVNCTVKVEAAATGGKGPYQYQFSDDYTGTVLQAFSSSDTFELTPDEVGAYNIVVTVKDAYGNTSQDRVLLTAQQVGFQWVIVSPTGAVPGQSIRLMAATNNYHISTTFRYIIDGEDTSEIIDSQTGTSTWTPTKAGTYNITTQILFNGTVINAKTTSYTVEESDLSASVKFDGSATVPVGFKVGIDASAQKGSGSYTYKYSYVLNGKETVIKDFTADTHVDFTPKSAAAYTIKVTAKDAYGNTATATKKLTAAEVNFTSFVASPKSVKEGETVKLVAVADNYNIPLTYRYTATKDGASEVLTADASGAAQWTPKSAGNYTITAEMLYNDSVVTTKTITYTVEKKVSDNLVTIYYKGYAAPQIEYQLSDGKWSESAAMTRVTAIDGVTHKYTINLGTESQAVVRFNNGKGKTDDLAGQNYTFTKGLYTYQGGMISTMKNRDMLKTNTLVSTPSVSAETIALGKKVTVSCQSTGGTGKYEYSFSYRKLNSTKWTTKQSFAANNSIDIKPGALGKYVVCVKVRDGSGIAQKKYFVVDVVDSVAAASNISATSIKLGEKITATGAATGGSGKYEYAVFYKKKTSEKWSTIQNYGKNSVVNITPAVATTYDICVKVKDKVTGTIDKQYFEVEVTK